LVDFAVGYLAVSIREKLSIKVHQGYSKEGSLARISEEISDFDQRATCDIEKVSLDMSVMYLSIFKPMAESILLSRTLGKMMGFRQLALCYSYFALMGTWSRFVTPSLKTLSSKVQADESLFKSSHSRIKEYSEEIQFLHGEKTEAGLLDGLFAQLCRSNVAFALQKFTSSALDGYVVRYLGILVALGMMTPALSKQGRKERVKDPTEFFLTCLHLLVNLMGAFKDVAVAFRTMGTIRGLATRVLKVIKVANTEQVLVENVLEPISGGEEEIVISNLKLHTPASPENATKSLLFNNLSLKFRTGESVFIKGPNGMGKTSLLRVLAGSWKATSGSVRIPSDACMFLTQRPYIVPGLPLGQQVLYPNIEYNEEKAERVFKALLQVGLLLPETPIQVLETPWKCQNLSTGEAQRLACARLILSRPKFAFVDELTSSCTVSIFVKVDVAQTLKMSFRRRNSSGLFLAIA